MSCKIASHRSYEKWPSWYVVYEWEDIISKCLGWEIELIEGNSLSYRIKRKYKSLRYRFLHHPSFDYVDLSEMRILFIMSAGSYYQSISQNIIPIFLDFPEAMVDIIALRTKKLPFYFVTSVDIFNKLKNAGSGNVVYMPLSISDNYYTKTVPKKRFDVIQFGRKNPMLHQWMMEYCRLNSNVDYIYQSSNGSLTYTSTKNGNLGLFDTRKEYMELMSSCRISLVSTPSMDNSRVDFGSVDFFTPRFFESAVFYCHMIGRYAENEEADKLKIHDICHNAKDKEDFFVAIEKCLALPNEINVDKYDDFLQINLTSKRAAFIKNIASGKKAIVCR